MKVKMRLARPAKKGDAPFVGGPLEELDKLCARLESDLLPARDALQTMLGSFANHEFQTEAQQQAFVDRLNWLMDRLGLTFDLGDGDVHRLRLTPTAGARRGTLRFQSNRNKYKFGSVRVPSRERLKTQVIPPPIEPR